MQHVLPFTSAAVILIDGSFSDAFLCLCRRLGSRTDSRIPPETCAHHHCAQIRQLRTNRVAAQIGLQCAVNSLGELELPMTRAVSHLNLRWPVPLRSANCSQAPQGL